MKAKRAALFLVIGGLVSGASLPSAAVAGGFVSDAGFQSDLNAATAVAPVGYAPCDETACESPACHDESVCTESSTCDGSCDCESVCACDACGCPFDYEIGDPLSLFGEAGGYTIGGWVQLGYHTKADSLFNSRPNDFQVQQAWVYAEKTLDTTNGFGVGGRMDYVYGTDGPDTQAFGIANDHWDNGWDNGRDYGHALPQVYGEVGYGDLSFKVGHFFTLIGYEVVAAPDNFFYSHAYTMYNSEPFTHTGALGTWNASENLTVYGGYVLGWDSGFENNGDAFLGGASLALHEDMTVTYMGIGGRFADGNANRLINGFQGVAENGYMHSIVTDLTLTDQLQYIVQSDYLSTENPAGAAVRETYGMNNYLLYTVSDCLATGARFEWYDADGVYDNKVDIYALTLGLNFKPHANVLIRPEVRFDFVDGNAAGILEDNQDDQQTFGMDTIFLF